MQSTGDDPEFISEADAAAMLHNAIPTLRFWRYTGTGPTYYKIGRRVAYRRADVISYMLSCAVKPGVPA